MTILHLKATAYQVIADIRHSRCITTLLSNDKDILNHTHLLEKIGAVTRLTAVLYLNPQVPYANREELIRHKIKQLQ